MCVCVRVCMYSIEARWSDPVFLANGLTVLSAAEHKFEFIRDCVTQMCKRLQRYGPMKVQNIAAGAAGTCATQ
jgi:hypothetical protein